MPETTRVLTVSFRMTMRDIFGTLFWINFRKFWFFTLVLPICIVYAAFNYNDQSNFPWAMAWVCGLWVMFTFVFPYLGVRAAAKSPNFQDVLQYTFSEGGIDFAGKYSSAHLDWKLVTRVNENNPYVMFQVGRQSLHLIPKACFSSEDLKSLKELLRTSVSGKVRLKH